MKRQRSKTHPASATPRPRRRVYDEHFDPYAPAGKLADLTACPRCGALYRDGRWTWATAPAGSTESVCPACRRIEDGYPGGTLCVTGAFLDLHRDEIEAMLRHVEEREKAEHPLERIMALESEDKGLRIDTTDPRLARSLGEALRRAYQGELDLPESQPAELARVHWHRD